MLDQLTDLQHKVSHKLLFDNQKQLQSELMRFAKFVGYMNAGAFAEWGK